MKLNVGCGLNRVDGAFNLDIDSWPCADVIGDALRLPFVDGAFERVESRHLITAFGFCAAMAVIGEMVRVLSLGDGILSIEFTDKLKEMNHYYQCRDHIDDQLLLHMVKGAGEELRSAWSFREMLEAVGETGLEFVDHRECLVYHPLTPIPVGVQMVWRRP